MGNEKQKWEVRLQATKTGIGNYKLLRSKSMTKKQITKWLVYIKKDGKVTNRRAMTNYGRMMPWLQANLFPDCTIFIRANYGKHQDNFGDMVTFENEGEYGTYEQALQAAQAFQEVAREWEASND